MNKMLIPLIAGLLCLSPLAQAEVKSLRGDRPPNEDSRPPIKPQYRKDGEVLPRDFVQQPPLIPHKIDGYQIDLRYNKCLSCHGWDKYREAGATKISQTHFKDREGNDLADIAPTRYFCNQCHVPQANAKPLVENTFQPVESLKEK
ncbi:MAG: nitrate reductase cytochrome c-type subunit [Gammaproteobacteria bacterium]|nr:MAG: nitrate reductase cytochrome c-type subunit [Gammaproteobacteria bacterium]